MQDGARVRGAGESETQTNESGADKSGRERHESERSRGREKDTRLASAHPCQNLLMAPTSAPTHALARLLAIAAYTLLPLASVLALGWDWREVIILYWLENLTLGAAMVIRLLRTRGDPGPEPMIINDRRVSQTPKTIGWLARFFVLHYGLFTLVHGVFVFLIATGVFSGFATTTTTSTTSTAATVAAETGLAGVDGPGILIIWIIAGIAQLLIAARGPLPARRGTALMMSAYPRIIVLHLGVIGGAILIAESGWPPIAAVLLIALHGIVDAFGWMLSARRANRPGSGPTVSIRLG